MCCEQVTGSCELKVIPLLPRNNPMWHVTCFHDTLVNTRKTKEKLKSFSYFKYFPLSCELIFFLGIFCSGLFRHSRLFWLTSTVLLLLEWDTFHSGHVALRISALLRSPVNLSLWELLDLLLKFQLVMACASTGFGSMVPGAPRRIAFISTDKTKQNKPLSGWTNTDLLSYNSVGWKSNVGFAGLKSGSGQGYAQSAGSSAESISLSFPPVFLGLRPLSLSSKPVAAGQVLLTLRHSDLLSCLPFPLLRTFVFALDQLE